MLDLEISNPAVIRKIYNLFDDNYECHFDLNDVKYIQIYDDNCKFVKEGGAPIDHGHFSVPPFLCAYLNSLVNLRYLNEIVNFK